ncbi:helix-turn-helix domain-containing protein [Weissella kandleri]|uniref:helix-turn-helix domain-containing protein n=1 Tax=Weissella kandleri TaxID=1616 RepID=UPI00387EB140
MQIDKYLEQKNLTRYQVAKISGIQPSTLSDAKKRPINRMTVKTLQALAMATADTPGKVLDSLIELEGDPIANFIEAHPFINKNIIQDVQSVLDEVKFKNVDVSNVTFNRYYDEEEDTNENAEVALKNMVTTLEEIIEKLN